MPHPSGPVDAREPEGSGARAGSGERVDLVVLAGGRGSRLGGADKGALVVGGRTLLERLVDGVDLGGDVVVVQPGELPEGLGAGFASGAGSRSGSSRSGRRLLRTLEDPPDGGPVAGIAAGLGALGESAAAWVAVVAVDQPQAAEALAALAEELPGVGEDVEAVSHVDATGHRQWLLAIYRRSALTRALAALPSTRDTSVRRLVGDLVWHEVEPGAEHVGDVDTWDDLAAWRSRHP